MSNPRERNAKAKRDTRVRHWSELRLLITCPTCRRVLGRCADEDTREHALATHAQHCTGTPTP